MLGQRPGRLIVVAPTAHLKVQWAAAARRMGLHLDPAWSPLSRQLAPDLHGIVTTYQQVASSAKLLAPLADDAFVILDEIHHAADQRAWGDSVRQAFDGARRRLALSGTPFRSDTAAIPFVNYVLDEAVADYVYGYGDALRDGRVVRPVYFPRTGGEFEWVAPDGSEMAASFDDQLDAALGAAAAHRPEPDGQWLPTVLRNAHQRPTTLPPSTRHRRVGDRHRPGARRGIATMMQWRLGVDAVVVTSDDAGPRHASPASPRAATVVDRGADGERGVDIRASVSASMPRPRPPSCSSARRSGASCAGGGANATRRSCSSPTTPGCAPRLPDRRRAPPQPAQAGGGP